MKQREQFGSKLGFILVSAGCAIGLGNVWKFPYICGQYGGGAFILLYLGFLIILGTPLLICEVTVGRGSKRGVAKAFDVLEPKGEKWHLIKWGQIAGNYLLMMFYTMVCGWMLAYAVKMATGQLSNINSTQIENTFSNLLASPLELILWTVISTLIAFFICSLGLRGGIERITKIMMTVLILMMIALAINSFTLENASVGINFYIVPSIEHMFNNGISETIFAAMTHAFFTLSIGIGSMEIFGSYLDDKSTVTGQSISIVCIDTFVALMAGFIIIPACFSFGISPDAGPSLLFITLPNVFDSMPGGRVWGTLFFIFMFFAALSTVITVYENILSFFMDGLEWPRKKAVAVNIVLIIILSLPAILGFNVLSDIQPIGDGSSIMDLEDFLVSYNLLPLGSLVFVLFATRKNGWGFDNFLKEANTGSGLKLHTGLRIYMSYILPLIVIIIYLKGYYDIFAPQGTAMLVGWMCFAILLVSIIFVIASGVLNRTKRKA